MVRLASALLLSVVASAAVVGRVDASCNSFPSADQKSLLAPTDTLQNYGFKGALGRIDRVQFLPATGIDPTSSNAPAMIVVPDGICVGPGGEPIGTAPLKLPPTNDLVALVSFRLADGGRPAVRLYAPKKICDTLLPAAEAEADRMKGSVAVMHPCSMEGVHTVQIGSFAEGLSIPLPDATAIAEKLGAAGVLGMRVVVAHEHDASLLLEMAGSAQCSQTCQNRADAMICIDDIFAPSVGASGQPTYSPDRIPCDLQSFMARTNDFSKACENEDTSPPACKPGDLPDLAMWHDKCGGVHVPFDWKDIRPSSSSTENSRWVRGRTGIGREKSDQNPRVMIPGREFVGSTPIKDPQGNSSNWRKPLITVWASGSPDEFGLEGTIEKDKDDSIVHIFPRMPTRIACKDASPTHACMGVEQDDTSGGMVSCACDNQTGCTCEQLANERYFVCRGAMEGMPCTRDKHCFPDGQCDGTPHCQQWGAVWNGKADDSGTECTTDSVCTQGKKTQCGYRLFNLEGAVDDVTTTTTATTSTTTTTIGKVKDKEGTIVLEGRIASTGAHKRRGVCKKTGTPCGNGNGPGACSADDCRGYQLKAGPLK